MASAISALLSNSNAPAQSGAASSLGQAPSEQMFLQLLVAQIQNQDPLAPTDSTQFVSQLAQFSELEQVIGIRQDIEAATASNAASGTSGTTNGSGAGSSSSISKS